jgi:nucleotide-binding universal stress UspA family protein
MGYRTIVVHLNDERRCDRLLEHATAYAERFDAHLTGIFVAPQPILYGDWPGIGLGEVLEQARLEHIAIAQRLEEKFRSATKALRQASEWRFVQSLMASVAEDVIDCGRSADLIIASQADPGWHRSDDMDVPDRLAIESGRPVLLVPNRGKLVPAARRITIGWNERREAARAVFDALPLLKKAEAVNVVWISPAVGGAVEGDLPGSELCRTLARHGVKCEASWVDATDTGAGPELLRQAKVYGSELLVMGAYGHSRVREFVLGGASRHMLMKADIPVLMSH